MEEINYDLDYYIQLLHDESLLSTEHLINNLYDLSLLDVTEFIGYGLLIGGVIFIASFSLSHIVSLIQNKFRP